MSSAEPTPRARLRRVLRTEVVPLWRRLGSPDAISWVTVASFFPIALLFTLYGAGIPHTPTTVPRLVLASLASSTCTVTWLLLAQRWIFVWSPRARRTDRAELSRPWAVIVAFVIALVVRAVTVDSFLQVAGLTDESRLGYRFISSIPSNGGLLVVVGLLVPLAREYGRDIARLASVEREFAALAAEAPARVEAERQRVIQLARVGIEERLREIAGEAAPATLARVRATIEDLVRPLSHRLGSIDTDEVDEFMSGPDEAPGLRAVLRGVVDRNPLRPITSAVWLGLSSLISAPLLWGADAGFEFTALVFVVVLGLCAIVSLVWEPWIAPLRRGWRVFWYTAMTALAGATIGCVSAFLSPAIRESWVSLAVTLVITSIVVGWMFAASFSLGWNSRELAATLANAEQQLHEQRVRLNALRRAEMRALGRILHGPVQDALSVVAFRMRAAVDAEARAAVNSEGEGEGASEAANRNGRGAGAELLLAEVRRSVEGALNDMDDVDRAAAPAPETLAQLVVLWDGLAEVTWQLEPSAAQALQGHTATRSSFNEIVREACSNAVRHGGAERIAITVSGSESGTGSGAQSGAAEALRVRVVNDGAPPEAGAQAGFGTRLLDELALSWRRDAEGGETTLSVELPLID